MAAVQEDENGCWLYKGVGDRYGAVNLSKGKNQLAHRFSYIHFKGPIPPGLFICHKCDVRGCVNPDHLYAGTHEDNTRDIVDRKRFGRRIPTLPKVVRSRANRYKQRFLTSAERKQMVEEYLAGKYTQQELAKRYHLTQSTVSRNIREWKKPNDTNGKRREGHYRRKLEPDAYDKIRAEYGDGTGITQTELAAKFGIDQTYVSAIIKRKTRRDLAIAAVNQET